MNTSLSWLKAYVPDLDVTAQEYTDAMTLSGTKVEGYEQLDADLEKIVIGQIDKIEKHPDADKLVVCQVNVGTETVPHCRPDVNLFLLVFSHTATSTITDEALSFILFYSTVQYVLYSYTLLPLNKRTCLRYAI